MTANPPLTVELKKGRCFLGSNAQFVNGQMTEGLEIEPRTKLDDAGRKG